MEVSLTTRHGARPAAILLAGDDRLALHHVVRVAVELHEVTGLVHALALDVAVLRHSGRVTLHLYDHTHTGIATTK
jgi:hypothetical protein